MHDVRISVWQIGTAMRPEWKLVENQTPNVPSKTMIFRKIEPVLSHFWAIEENFARCLNPTTGDRIVWHTDMYDHRIVAFSLNLTVQEYRGGTCKFGIEAQRKSCTKFATRSQATLFSCILRTSYSIASSPSKGTFPGPPWQGGFAGKREMRILMMPYARRLDFPRRSKRPSERS